MDTEEVENTPRKDKKKSFADKLNGLIGSKISLPNNVKTPPVKVPAFLRNFYFWVFGTFLVWMLFFDTNDFITQYRRQQKLNQLKKAKVFYAKGIVKIKKERAELSSNPKLLEKFARERYYFKKKKEDVYVILEEKKKNADDDDDVEVGAVDNKPK